MKFVTPKFCYFFIIRTFSIDDWKWQIFFSMLEHLLKKLYFSHVFYVIIYIFYSCIYIYIYIYWFIQLQFAVIHISDCTESKYPKQLLLWSAEEPRLKCFFQICPTWIISSVYQTYFSGRFFVSPNYTAVQHYKTKIGSSIIF